MKNNSGNMFRFSRIHTCGSVQPFELCKLRLCQNIDHLYFCTVIVFWMNPRNLRKDQLGVVNSLTTISPLPKKHDETLTREPTYFITHLFDMMNRWCILTTKVDQNSAL